MSARRPTRARTLLSGSLLLLSLLPAGCQVGKRVEELRPAVTARGTEITFTLRRPRLGTITGELICVREDDMIVLTTRGYTSVAYGISSGVRYEDAPTVGGWKDTPEKRAELARYSRYPFGVSDELLAELLARRDQARLEEVR